MYNLLHELSLALKKLGHVNKSEEIKKIALQVGDGALYHGESDYNSRDYKKELDLMGGSELKNREAPEDISDLTTEIKPGTNILPQEVSISDTFIEEDVGVPMDNDHPLLKTLRGFCNYVLNYDAPARKTAALPVPRLRHNLNEEFTPSDGSMPSRQEDRMFGEGQVLRAKQMVDRKLIHDVTEYISSFDEDLNLKNINSRASFRPMRPEQLLAVIRKVLPEFSGHDNQEAKYVLHESAMALYDNYKDQYYDSKNQVPVFPASGPEIPQHPEYVAKLNS